MLSGDAPRKGDELRKRAAEKFSLSRMLDETEDVYSEIAGN
jgi:hypothetical protein